MGGPWVHFYIAKKKCTQGGGTPLSTFSLLIPRQENVLKGVGPPPVHFLKKMYRHKGDVFLLYLFGGGGGFGLKKNVLKGVGGPWLHFFLLFSPPPPFWNPRGGGPKYIFNPPSPPRKNVHYIFGGPPLKLGVKGVGIFHLLLLEITSDWLLLKGHPRDSSDQLVTEHMRSAHIGKVL